MEHYGTLWIVHGTPWTLHGTPWTLHGTPWNSMELHGTPWTLHGHSMEFPWSSMEFHGLPWNSMDFHGIPSNSMEFHGGISHGYITYICSTSWPVGEQAIFLIIGMHILSISKNLLPSIKCHALIYLFLF